MSALRYKTLLTYLPGMASVVNSFSSAEVQLHVYESLMAALNDKLHADGIGAPANTNASVLLREPVLRMGQSQSTSSENELAHDLVDGDSIHALGAN